jgi:putative ABC transport system permease protein
MLELKNIKKSYYIGYNEQPVLKGINVKFRRNEFTSILGASGSGKTTLLNIIGGLDKYDDGDLIIDGNSTKNYSDRDWDSYRNYRVGFIFQSYNLIGHQSVLSNVEIALTLTGVSKEERKRRAKDALIKVGLEDHINKKPSQLSGGQMQRVAIARALVNDPEIILADEPTGALDSETSVQIMDLLKEVAKDRLIIMVTHNPEIAKKYSTRIIELKDGIILKDSNPVKDKKEDKYDKAVKKTSMSLLTSLGLSYNNLLTKMGRTILTALAGSIGIIGIALILSLTNGVRGYVKQMERDSLTSFPIQVEKDKVDISKLFSFEEEEKIECEKGKICSRNDIARNISMVIDGMIKKNDLSQFKKYLEEKEEFEKNAIEITYGYNLDLQIYSSNNIKVNPNTFNVFSGIPLESEEAKSIMSSYTRSDSVFTELLDNEEFLKEQYEVLAGTLPKEYNEIVILVSKDNIISDSVLYALDIKDRSEMKNNMEDIDKNSSTTYSYEDLLNRSYKLVLNADYYKKSNGLYIDVSNDYNYMKNLINNGLDIKVVGVLKAKKDADYDKVGYKHSLTEYVINETSKKDIYKDQTSNKEINVLTGVKFSDTETTYEDVTKQLGIADLNNPSIINIYPKDFDSKEKIISLIDKYNDEQKKNGKEEYVIDYTDSLKMLVDSLTSIITIISVVLIGFVAISLIVSSIMISIITYISVLERTKEIGILRAIGASKKDVSRVFIAETIIEGLFAGCLGIFVAFLICQPINVLVEKFADISNIATLPIGGSIFLILLSVGLNVIAGIIPAKMAAKKDPVVALRSE